MSEKRCFACRMPLAGDTADCPVCGYPDYIVPNMKPEMLKKMQMWADDHRKDVLNGIEVDIYAYSHEMRDNKLRQKSVDIVKICDAQELSFDDIFWLNEKFARIDTDKELTLTVVIKKAGTEVKKQEFSFKAPDLKDFWYIGAQLTEGLGVRLIVGNDNTNVKMESIALI